jgi:hypothetical protein
MRKIIFISLLLMAGVSALQAQKKVIYADTSLLQEEEVLTAPAEDIQAADDTISTALPAETLDEDGPADTVLYKNDLKLSYDSVKNWRELKSFAYNKYLDSLLKSEKNKAQKQPPFPRRNIFSGLFNSGAVTVILWLMAIAFVLFIIYRLFLADGAFRRTTKQAKNTDAGVEEEIITRESDFVTLIRQALQSRNYRQAVRYQYLRTLHMLAEKNMLQLAPDKTNFQYVGEITDRNVQQDFASLTLNYEYVWYGEFEIDKNIYDKIDSNFTGFNRKL